MNYYQVLKWVMKNNPELKICHDMVELNSLDGYAADFCRGISNLEKEGGVGVLLRVTCKYVCVNNYNCVLLANFKNEDVQKLALLHELGHHLEDQEGDIIYREIKAWEGCFKYFDQLNMKITDSLKKKVGLWFGSYINNYGYDSRCQEFLLKYGIPLTRDVRKYEEQEVLAKVKPYEFENKNYSYKIVDKEELRWFKENWRS